MSLFSLHKIGGQIGVPNVHPDFFIMQQLQDTTIVQQQLVGSLDVFRGVDVCYEYA